MATKQDIQIAPRPTLLVWAFWLSLILSIIAAPLLMLYLLLLTQIDKFTLGLTGPILISIVTFAHTSIVMRDYSGDQPSISLAVHGLVALSGPITLVLLFVKAAAVPEGGVVLFLIVPGCAIAAWVCKSFWLRLRGSKSF